MRGADILELREGVCGGTVRIRVEPLLAALDQGRSMRAATESFLATVSAPTGLDFADLCYLLFFARAADADGNGGVDDFEFAGAVTATALPTHVWASDSWCGGCPSVP